MKATIYLPIGHHNSGLSSETQLVRYIQKNTPRELRVTGVIDTYIENNHSSVTVEVEKIEQGSIDANWLIENLENKIEKARSSKLKQELTELLNEIKGKLNSK